MKKWTCLLALTCCFFHAKAQQDSLPLEQVFFSVPSPIEFYLVLQENDINFDIKLTHLPTKVSRYKTFEKQALNMGVYEADWSWEITSGKVSPLLYHLNSIWILASKLNTVHQQEEWYKKRIEKNLNNKDSLLIITSDLMRNITFHLNENNREDITALILVGGWIETMYHLTTFAQVADNKELKEKVAFQKNTLENIVGMLRQLEASKRIQLILNDLSELEATYNAVKLDYKYRSPKTDKAKNATTLRSKVKVNITDDQLKKITEQTKTLRSRITE